MTIRDNMSNCEDIFTFTFGRFGAKHVGMISFVMVCFDESVIAVHTLRTGSHPSLFLRSSSSSVTDVLSKVPDVLCCREGTEEP